MASASNCVNIYVLLLQRPTSLHKGFRRTFPKLCVIADLYRRTFPNIIIKYPTIPTTLWHHAWVVNVEYIGSSKYLHDIYTGVAIYTFCVKPHSTKCTHTGFDRSLLSLWSAACLNSLCVKCGYRYRTADFSRVCVRYAFGYWLKGTSCCAANLKDYVIY